MKSWLKHPFRSTARLLWFITELTLAAFRYIIFCSFRPQSAMPALRAEWLQNCARRVLRSVGVKTSVIGTVPTSGLLVSNHLSYVDVLVLASLTRARFVSKSEVKSWPVFGWFATIGGTLFVERERRTHAGLVADEIEAALRGDVLLVLFPEGTSSGGQTVLPFKSSLLEPVARKPKALSASLIRYDLDDGDATEEVCYWKDMVFLPHVLNLLSKSGVRATVRFTQLQPGSSDRKELARQLHSEVVKLKEAVGA